MDHLIMFNREQFGLHHPGNIVPACNNCNKRSKSADNRYNNWEDHLSKICESNGEGEKFLERWKKIKNHINNGSYKYPKITEEEYKTLKIITNNLYDSIKSEFEQSQNLFKEIDKAFSKK